MGVLLALFTVTAGIILRERHSPGFIQSVFSKAISVTAAILRRIDVTTCQKNINDTIRVSSRDKQYSDSPLRYHDTGKEPTNERAADSTL